MTKRFSALPLVCGLVAGAALLAQTPQTATARDFDCYVELAEARMEARQVFLMAEVDEALDRQVVQDQRIRTMPADGPNPHTARGGQIHDWIGTVFIPGATLDRTVQILRDYDNRARYFPRQVASSKLLCRSGADHFGYTMRIKQPGIIDVESDVVWERVDEARWRARSYSTRVEEVSGNHHYIERLYSYWRVAAAESGVYVEAETITLTGEFGAVQRALAPVMGLSPEGQLRRTLNSLRQAVLHPPAMFQPAPRTLPACAAEFRPSGCRTVSTAGRPTVR
jgi:hypothetical protein